MSDYILDAEPGHIGSSNRTKKTRQIAADMTWGVKNKTEMTWIPADDGLIAEDAPKNDGPAVTSKENSMR